MRVLTSSELTSLHEKEYLLLNDFLTTSESNALLRTVQTPKYTHFTSSTTKPKHSSDEYDIAAVVEFGTKRTNNILRYENERDVFIQKVESYLQKSFQSILDEDIKLEFSQATRYQEGYLSSNEVKSDEGRFQNLIIFFFLSGQLDLYIESKNLIITHTIQDPTTLILPARLFKNRRESTKCAVGNYVGICHEFMVAGYDTTIG